MALFRDLSRAISEAEGISEMTVSGIGQYLRDAGLISKHGRGRAAAHMTVGDAVNLLIGVSASDLAKNSVDTVRLYRNLEVGPGSICNKDDEVPRFITDERNCFGSALEYLISELAPVHGGPSKFDNYLKDTSAHVEVGFGRPIPSGFINIHFDGPPNVSNPFGWTHENGVAAFSHYWNAVRLWSDNLSRKELKILGVRTLSRISATIST